MLGWDSPRRLLASHTLSPRTAVRAPALPCAYRPGTPRPALLRGMSGQVARLLGTLWPQTRGHSASLWPSPPAGAQHMLHVTIAGWASLSPEAPRGGVHHEEASPVSSSGSPRTGAAIGRRPLAGAFAGSSSRGARRAVSGSGPGLAAGRAQACTAGYPHPQGAPVTATGGAARTAPRAPRDTREDLSCPRCHPQSHYWPRPAGALEVKWGQPQGRFCPATRWCLASWHSRHCGIASWRPESRLWSRQDAMGTSSGPARLAPTETGSVAWWAVPRAALSCP